MLGEEEGEEEDEAADLLDGLGDDDEVMQDGKGKGKGSGAAAVEMVEGMAGPPTPGKYFSAPDNGQNTPAVTASRNRTVTSTAGTQAAAVENSEPPCVLPAGTSQAPAAEQLRRLDKALQAAEERGKKTAAEGEYARPDGKPPPQGGYSRRPGDGNRNRPVWERRVFHFPGWLLGKVARECGSVYCAANCVPLRGFCFAGECEEMGLLTAEITRFRKADGSRCFRQMIDPFLMLDTQRGEFSLSSLVYSLAKTTQGTMTMILGSLDRKAREHILHMLWAWARRAARASDNKEEVQHLAFWAAEVRPPQGVGMCYWSPTLMMDTSDIRDEGHQAATWGSCIEEVLLLREPLPLLDVRIQGTGTSSKDFAYQGEEQPKTVGFVKVSTKALMQLAGADVGVGTLYFWPNKVNVIQTDTAMEGDLQGDLGDGASDDVFECLIDMPLSEILEDKMKAVVRKLFPAAACVRVDSKAFRGTAKRTCLRVELGPRGRLEHLKRLSRRVYHEEPNQPILVGARDLFPRPTSRLLSVNGPYDVYRIHREIFMKLDELRAKDKDFTEERCDHLSPVAAAVDPYIWISNIAELFQNKDAMSTWFQSFGREEYENRRDRLPGQLAAIVHAVFTLLAECEFRYDRVDSMLGMNLRRAGFRGEHRQEGRSSYRLRGRKGLLQGIPETLGWAETMDLIAKICNIVGVCPPSQTGRMFRRALALKTILMEYEHSAEDLERLFGFWYARSVRLASLPLPRHHQGRRMDGGGDSAQGDAKLRVLKPKIAASSRYGEQCLIGLEIRDSVDMENIMDEIDWASTEDGLAPPPQGLGGSTASKLTSPGTSGASVNAASSSATPSQGTDKIQDPAQGEGEGWQRVESSQQQKKAANKDKETGGEKEKVAEKDAPPQAPLEWAYPYHTGEQIQARMTEIARLMVHKVVVPGVQLLDVPKDAETRVTSEELPILPNKYPLRWATNILPPRNENNLASGSGSSASAASSSSSSSPPAGASDSTAPLGARAEGAESAPGPAEPAPKRTRTSFGGEDVTIEW